MASILLWESTLAWRGQVIGSTPEPMNVGKDGLNGWSIQIWKLEA